MRPHKMQDSSLKSFAKKRAVIYPTPLFGAPQAPGDEPNPSEEGLSLGGRPPEARGDVSSGGTHPTELCSTQSQPVESAPAQDTMQRQERADKR